MVEQETHKLLAVGSNPTLATDLKKLVNFWQAYFFKFRQEIGYRLDIELYHYLIEFSKDEQNCNGIVRQQLGWD